MIKIGFIRINKLKVIGLMKDYKQDDISLHLLIDRMTDGFWLVNNKGVILDVNQQYLTMTGYKREEVINHKISDFELIETEADVIARMERIASIGKDKFDSKHMCKSGQCLDVEVMASTVPDKPELLFGLIRDISRRKNYESQLNLTKQVIDQAREGILVTDETGIIHYVNKAFTSITGYTKEEVLGLTPAILNSGMQSPVFYEQMWQTLEKKGCWAAEVWNKKKSGEIYPEWLNITALKQGEKTTHYIAHFNDISESKKLTSQQEFLEFHDQLTTLPNLKLFHQRIAIAEMLYQKQEVPYAIILLDIKKFKLVNDALGHSIGDRVLKAVAQRIAQHVRLSDTVARYSGNQFVILISDPVISQNLPSICLNLANYFKTPFNVANQSLALSVSIGAAVYPFDTENSDTLLAYAETALYQAKQNYDPIQIFNQEIKERLYTRNKLEQALSKAVSDDQLKLYFQPQVNSETKDVFAIECLLRWEHPEYGLISPSTFIPIAEESGLICEIGDWVFEQAASYVRKWQLTNIFSGAVAINVSMAQLVNPHYLDHVKQMLVTTLVEPNQIEIEVTESLFSDPDSNCLALLTELHKMGFPIAIDDFGTGYSSLHRIKMMPINTIKIDKCFIDNIETDPSDQAIVQAVVNIAKSVGLNVLAEGVETAAQAAKLAEFGCLYCQGYFYAKPKPIEQFETWLADFRAKNDSQFASLN